MWAGRQQEVTGSMCLQQYSGASRRLEEAGTRIQDEGAARIVSYSAEPKGLCKVVKPARRGYARFCSCVTGYPSGKRLCKGYESQMQKGYETRKKRFCKGYERVMPEYFLVEYFFYTKQYQNAVLLKEHKG